MSAAEAENIPTNVSSGDAEAAVKGAKAKKTKEAKPKKKPAVAEKKKAPKKKASSSPPSHPKYEERLVASEKLVKVKGSFKLSSAKPAASAPVNKEPEAKASKKPAAAKPKAKERPIKASRTSSRTSPEKKAADAETAVVAAEKKDLPAKREFINWTFPYL
ncbi:Histone H1.2 [Raphanus sativus]|nr:Histone H1.2 [Raphanus sativus]